jgi:hypothetical protein
MLQEPHVFPPMPAIGKPESYYADLIHKADLDGNTYAHEAAKVGQYITLALNPTLDWPAKLRFFQHSLNRHCALPPSPDKEVSAFYHKLCELICNYAGQEALRMASAEDDIYATRLGLGANREEIESEAEEFFSHLIGAGEKRPAWFNEYDWMQLRLIRDQWI